MIRKASTRIAILLCLTLVTAYWVTGPYRKTHRKQRESETFRDHLVAVIEGAEQIDLVEHSGRLDFMTVDGTPDETHPVIEYARIVLDSNQKKELAAIVRGVDAKPKDTFTLGIFDPHHSFEFRQNGVLSQWMSVCFSSHYLTWYIKPGDPWVEEQTLEPEGLIDALKAYIQRRGLRVGVNWQEIAERPGDAQPATQPADIAPEMDQPPTPTSRDAPR